MTDYYPDKFLLVEIEYQEETLMKVFGTWAGGYATGDSWKLNSGISGVTADDDTIHFSGYSGSIYHCHPDMYGSVMSVYGVILNMVEKATVPARIFTEEEMLTYVKEKTDA